MKKVTPFILVLLAMIAAAALAAVVTGIPSAYRRFDHEREDLLILVTLSIFFLGLGTFWVFSGVQMFRRPAGRLPRAMRSAAWVVLVAGGSFFLSAAIAPIDAILSCVLASACIASAAAVLNWGSGAAGA